MRDTPFNYNPKKLEAVLLKISAIGDTVILRIDNDSSMADQERGLPIRILTLRGVEIGSNILSNLSNGIDQPIYYDIDPDRRSVNFVINYIETDPPIYLRCFDVTENEEDYSYTDLVQKSARLTQLCVSLDDENWHLRHEHESFIARLQKIIEKDMDTAARKMEFFKERNPEKMAIIIGELETLKRVLSLIKDLTAQYKSAIN
jgi:hypothetical protein